MKEKVCFIIPEGGLSLATHSAYLLGFIEEVGKTLNTLTIIEKSADRNIPRAFVQKFKMEPFHILENLILCLRARFKGYKTFYVHYSYTGVLNAKIVTLIFGGRVFYWNCGMMWLFGKKRFLRFVLRMVDYLVTGNETMKKGYHENLGVPIQKIKVMPNWIDPERFVIREAEGVELKKRFGIKEGEPVVLFLHRLAPRKGSRYLPEIVKVVSEKIPNVKFIIAGSGPDENWLKEKSVGRGNIIFTGNWPNKMVPILMSISSVYIMPSEEEGFPRVIIESQASGLPYAGFDIGGTREISPREIQNHIHRVGDVVSLSKSIIELCYQDETERENLKKVLQNHVVRFERQNVAKIFINMIKSV